MHTFSPWKVKGDARIVASEAKWREPIKWNRDAESSGVRQRVVVDVDVFEDYKGEMKNSKGKKYYVGPSHFGQSTIGHVRDRLLIIIELTPHLDWVITRTPSPSCQSPSPTDTA